MSSITYNPWKSIKDLANTAASSANNAVNNTYNYLPQTPKATTTTSPTTNTFWDNLTNGVNDVSNIVGGLVNNVVNGTYNNPPPTPTIDWGAQIHSIYDPLKNADLEAIRSAYDSAISGYNGQRPLQDQYKYGALNTNDANYYQGQQGLRTAMEAGGQAAGAGQNITGEIALGAARGNGVNDINQTYTNNMSAIDQDVRDAQAQKTSQEAQVGSKWDSQIAQAIMNAQNANDPNTLSNALAIASATGKLSFGGTTTDTLPMLQYQSGNEHWDKTYALDSEAAKLNNELTGLGIDTAKINLSALPQQIKDEATLTAQKIKSGEIDIATGQAQLKELTDPNSITNQMAKIGLDTAKLNYAALPQQIKDQAAKALQDYQLGKLTLQQTQATINSIIAGTNQTNAETNNIQNGLSANGSSSSSNINSMGTADQVNNYNNLLSIYSGGGNSVYKNDPVSAYNYLVQHSSDNVKLLGQKLYDKLVSDIYSIASKTNTLNNSSSSIYNSTLSSSQSLKDQGYSEQEIMSKINATQGLSSQEKADIMNALFPG